MNVKPVKNNLDQKYNYLKITNKINKLALPKNSHPKFGKCSYAFK
jgi:hypothetical protein